MQTRIGNTLKALLERWRRHRQCGDTRAALGQLDTWTLRDIGLHRSEIGSIAAEAAGCAERQRITRFEPHTHR
jgi:uncharacterized protein YjiS (DUF1127 family)